LKAREERLRRNRGTGTKQHDLGKHC